MRLGMEGLDNYKACPVSSVMIFTIGSITTIIVQLSAEKVVGFGLTNSR